MIDITKLTGTNNYFEDFETGLVIRHARGKTMTVILKTWIWQGSGGYFGVPLSNFVG